MADLTDILENSVGGNMKKRANGYFVYLQRLAENAFIAAKYMKEVCSGSSFDRTGVEANTHCAVHTRTQMLESLSHEFLPPIEREDIASLAFALTRVMMRCNELLRFSAEPGTVLPTELLKGAANAYYYVKTVFDAVKCIDDSGSHGVAQCLSQAQTLSTQCAALLISMREYAFSLSVDTKKLLASVTFCDRCGSIYEQCDLTAEMIKIIMLKNG